MVAHRFAVDVFVGVVMLEREWILGVRAFEWNLFDFRECSFHLFS